MKDLMKMMKQAQELQGRMQQMQEELAALEVSGQSGAGMVRITLNGKGEMRSVKIDPSLLKPEDVEMVEDLVLAAVNEAHRRAEEMMKSALSRIAGPLAGGLPF